MPAIVIAAFLNSLKLSITAILCFTPRWSCSIRLFRYFDERSLVLAGPTWVAAGILIPFAFLGGLAGRPIGDRLGAKAFAVLAIALLAVAGAYTLGAAAAAFAAP